MKTKKTNTFIVHSCDFCGNEPEHSGDIQECVRCGKDFCHNCSKSVRISLEFPNPNEIEGLPKDVKNVWFYLPDGSQSLCIECEKNIDFITLSVSKINFYEKDEE